MQLNLFCLGAACLGLMLGYVFSWSLRKQEPQDTEVATLTSTVFSGVIMETIGKLECKEALPIYIIGVAAGFVIYLIAFRMKWPQIKQALADRQMVNPPLFPWLGCSHLRQDRQDNLPPRN